MSHERLPRLLHSNYLGIDLHYKKEGHLGNNEREIQLMGPNIESIYQCFSHLLHTPVQELFSFGKGHSNNKANQIDLPL